MNTGLEKKCAAIRLLATDVDGVLADGGIIYDGSGEELKRFNVKDGYICKYLRQAGIKLAVITGRSSKAVQRRAEELKFDYILQGVAAKLEALKEIAARENLAPSQIAYIGDDLNDLEAIRYAGLSATPADAFDYIANEVDYICTRKGGEGAFREFADLILKHRNHEQNPGDSQAHL